MDMPNGRTLLTIFQVAVVIGIPAIVVIAVTVGRRRDRKRHEALSRLATELGMPYTAEDPSLLPLFGGFPFAPTGDLPRTYSVMRGSHGGAPMLLFDYDVTIGTPNNRTILRRTVAAFDISTTPLPVFALEGGKQETFTRVIDKVLGADTGIDFSDDPEFARAYHVRGADADAVRRALSPTARAFLLTRDWKCRSTGRWLVLSWLKDRPEPTEYRAFIDAAAAGRAAIIAG